MEECPYGCPVCAGISVLKSVNPDVTAHLSTAGKEFLLAAKALMDSMAEQSDKARSEPPLEKVWFESEV